MHPDREGHDGMARRGTLFLVVGPSGAGKDTLITAARRALAGDARFVFPRRLITRPPEPDGEDSIAVSPAAFEAAREEGAFSLHWESHGLAYGIPRRIETELARGRSVVVNVSRTVVEEARRRLAPVRVIHVTAPTAVLVARLARRGRERPVEIAERLGRAAYSPPVGPEVATIDNGGELDRAVTAFLAALRAEI